MVFPLENEGTGEGRGEGGQVGWGQAKEPASQCASFVETTLQRPTPLKVPEN